MIDSNHSLIHNFVSYEKQQEVTDNIADEELITVSDDDKSISTPSFKRLRKYKGQKVRRKRFRKNFSEKYESDEDYFDIIFYDKKFDKFPIEIVTIGIQLKLLANVYLQNLDHTANIFLPYYVSQAQNNNGTFKSEKDFFRTKKNQMCVFVSGGLYNHWQKNIAFISNLFFAGEPIKLIRAQWIQKHLSKIGIHHDYQEEFKGREHELHSELYYSLFFKHFFLPALKDKLNTLTIYAFSWWDVCDNCEREYLSFDAYSRQYTSNLAYKIAAYRRYSHHYPGNTIIAIGRILQTKEENVWQKIWLKIKQYVNKTFIDDVSKEQYWTETQEGLELTKWLGQAFEENRVGLNGRIVKDASKGNILAYYEAAELQEHISYLKEKNWELSCWYKGPKYFDKLQLNWKRHWCQLVMPHFGWKSIDMHMIEDGDDCCQMCGYEGLTKVFKVTHPKFRLKERFLKLSKPQQEEFDDSVEDYLQFLWVGSECVQIMKSTRKEIEDWKENNSFHDQELKLLKLDEREANDDALISAEKISEKRAQDRKRRKLKKYRRY